jgi:2-haloacid dehalogenase
MRMPTSLRWSLLAAILIAIAPRGPALAQESPPRFKAVAFDYFVIFNANSVVPAVERAFPGQGAEFTRAWRAKQFEYGFLRSITGRHADFFKVTEDALVYTAEAMKLELTPRKRKSLLDAYLTLEPWPSPVEDRHLSATDSRLRQDVSQSSLIGSHAHRTELRGHGDLGRRGLTGTSSLASPAQPGQHPLDASRRTPTRVAVSRGGGDERDQAPLRHRLTPPQRTP